MDNIYPIYRMKKYKIYSVLAIQKHNEREKESYKSNPDIDTTRSHLNIKLKQLNRESYRAFIYKRIKDVNCKTVIKKNSIMMVESVITASPILFKNDEKEMVRFMQRGYQFICDRIGEENIISAVIHMDEDNPHIHICFVPLTEDNRLCASEIVGDRIKLSQYWQTGFFEHMKKEFPVLTRGEYASITKRKYIPAYLYKKGPKLDKLYNEIKAKLSNITLLNAKSRAEEVLEMLQQWSHEGNYFFAQLSKATEYTESLEEKNQKLTEELISCTEKISLLTQQRIHAIIEANNYKRKLNDIQKRCCFYEDHLKKIAPEALRNIRNNARNYYFLE